MTPLSTAISSLVESGATWIPVRNVASTKLHTLSGIQYGDDSPLQSLDVYFPHEVVSQHLQETPPPPPSPQRPRPVFIHLHGGGWSRGGKDTTFYGGPAMSQNAAAAGCIAVAPGYRLGKYPEFVHDAAAAIQWVRDNIADLGGDLSNVFLSGHSAGGHIASLLVLRHSTFLAPLGIPADFFRGLILVSGVYDLFSPLHKAPLDSKNKWFALAYVRPAFGTDERLRREASPLLLLDPTKDTSTLGRAASWITASVRRASLVIKEADVANVIDGNKLNTATALPSPSPSNEEEEAQSVTDDIIELNTSALPSTIIFNATFDMGLQENGELMAAAMAKYTEVQYKIIPRTDHASICWNTKTASEVNEFIRTHSVPPTKG